MMKVIFGSVLGGVVAGAVALVASAQGRPATEASAFTPPAANAPYAMTVADARSLTSASTAAPTLVHCEPHQEAVTRRAIVAGREVAEVTCVTRPDAPGLDMAAAHAAPAGNYQRPAYTQPDIVERPVSRSRTVAPPRRATSRAARQSREVAVPKRSWKKTAMIIGGSTGVGAGVGAIAGGKKGALIGAAIGGGSASIYEAIKRR